MRQAGSQRADEDAIVASVRFRPFNDKLGRATPPHTCTTVTSTYPPPHAAHPTMASALRAYSRQFERRPYLTLLITNGLLFSLGDVSAQLLSLGGAAPLAFDGAR